MTAHCGGHILFLNTGKGNLGCIEPKTSEKQLLRHFGGEIHISDQISGGVIPIVAQSSFAGP